MRTPSYLHCDDHPLQLLPRKGTKVIAIMSLPSSHKAAVVPEAGAQHQVVDRSLAPIGDDEVAVKVIATSINPVDWKMRDYRVFLSEYPAVLGSDAAGEVVSAGKSVTNVAVGDRVFFQGIIGNYDSSTFQQYVKIPAALLAKTPKKVSDEQAATFWVAGMVVATGFYHKSGMSLSPPWNADGASVGKGKTAVILGGSSSVGQYAIQFAKLSGFDHIVTSCSASHFDHLKSLGATTVLDRSQATTAEAFVKAIPSDSSVDFVYDTISSPSTQLLGVQILQALKGGKVLVVMPADEKAVKQSEEKDLPRHLGRRYPRHRLASPSTATSRNLLLHTLAARTATWPRVTIRSTDPWWSRAV